MDKKAKFNIIDVKSGDLINTMYEGDRIVRKESDEHLSTTTEIGKQEEFIKVFVKPLLKLSNMISNKEAWFVTSLLPFIDYTSGVLKHENGKCITMDDMMDNMDLKPSATYNLIKGLCDKGIIAKCKTEGQIYFAMNPFIFMKGKRVSNTLIDIFKETQWVNVFKEDN